MARLMALPDDSAKRQQILAAFGCYSLATVLLRIWQAPDDEKQLFKSRIMTILDDPALDPGTPSAPVLVDDGHDDDDERGQP